jgi:hypothetical protein
LFDWFTFEKTIQRFTFLKQILARQNLDVVGGGLSYFLSAQV